MKIRFSNDTITFRLDQDKFSERVFEIEADFIEKNIILSFPQLAAVYWLQKLGLWIKYTANPLGHLYLTLFEEGRDSFDFDDSLRSTLEQEIDELSYSSLAYTEYFLFETTHTSIDAREEIASKMLLVENEDELLDILVTDVLFDAFYVNLDRWPKNKMDVARMRRRIGLSIKYESDIVLGDEGNRLKKYLLEEHIFFYYELLDKEELDRFCKFREDLMKERVSKFLNEGKAFKEAYQKAANELLRIIPATLSRDDGVLIIPEWIFVKEQGSNWLIEEVHVFGDGKANVRERIELHLQIVKEMQKVKAMKMLKRRVMLQNFQQKENQKDQ